MECPYLTSTHCSGTSHTTQALYVTPTPDFYPDCFLHATKIPCESLWPPEPRLHPRVLGAPFRQFSTKGISAPGRFTTGSKESASSAPDRRPPLLQDLAARVPPSAPPGHRSARLLSFSFLFSFFGRVWLLQANVDSCLNHPYVSEGWSIQLGDGFWSHRLHDRLWLLPCPFQASAPAGRAAISPAPATPTPRRRRSSAWTSAPEECRADPGKSQGTRQGTERTHTSQLRQLRRCVNTWT